MERAACCGLLCMAFITVQSLQAATPYRRFLSTCGAPVPTVDAAPRGNPFSGQPYIKYGFTSTKVLDTKIKTEKENN